MDIAYFKLIIYTLLALLFFFIIINLMRKWHWDAVHNNLLDLVNVIGGSVLRQGFFSRPIYHGTYRGNEATINFSSEKTKKGRVNYIDITLAKKIQNSLTIASLNWLDERDETKDSFEIMNLKTPEKYCIRKSGKKIIKKNKDEAFNKSLENLHPFNFIFIGEVGLIFEKESDNIALTTRHPKLKNNIDLLYHLLNTLI